MYFDIVYLCNKKQKDMTNEITSVLINIFDLCFPYNE